MTLAEGGKGTLHMSWYPGCYVTRQQVVEVLYGADMFI